MRDAIPLLLGLIVPVAVVWLGLSGSKKNDAAKADQPAPPPPKPDELVCGCGHNLALHNLTEGKCHFMTRFVDGTNVVRFGDIRLHTSEAETGVNYLQCSCQQYTGPEHPSMYLSFKDMTNPGPNLR